MATDVILPALGMAQDTGKILRWIKAEGEQVAKGEPLVEIETDKATVEIEAPADGVLSRLAAAAGDDVPVGNVIAVILAPAEASQDANTSTPTPASDQAGSDGQDAINQGREQSGPHAVSPLASRIAAEHNLDLSQVKSAGRRIQKADVLTYLQGQNSASSPASHLTDDPATSSALRSGDVQASIHAADEAATREPGGLPAFGQDAWEEEAAQLTKPVPRLTMASPKARRLAAEQGKDLAAIRGKGPGGAILAADVLATTAEAPSITIPKREEAVSPVARVAPQVEQPVASIAESGELTLSNTWRIMAQRTTQSWTSVPHFYLVREVNATRLVAWREQVLKRSSEKVTYTDLLVKIVAEALHRHPRVNATWNEGKIALKQEVHVGLAVAVEEGLVVPVIHSADALGLDEIARQRIDLVAKAQAGKLRPVDISDGTFTISNLGMYHVDAFNAIINAPQGAILAIGRIAERVVPLNGQPAVQPMMVLTLSCDHRVVDGARGAQFLDTVANYIEEPLGLLG